MPRRRSAGSLKSICLLRIAHTMDWWCRHYVDNFAGTKVLYVIGPFDVLPQELVVELTSLLKKRQLLKRIHLQLLLQPHTERLDLSVGDVAHVSKDCRLYDGLTELIATRCHKFKYLNLSHCMKIPHKALIQLPRSLPSVQVLQLNTTRTSDAVLSALGGHCHALRELDVSYCPQVTDAGISALCVDLRQESGAVGCLELRSLSVYETSVTETGAICALNNLPFLKHFDCSVICAALHLHFRNFKKGDVGVLNKFQLENLWIDFDGLTTTQCLLILELVTELCPNVTKLSLDFEQPLQQTVLITFFKNLRELTIVCNKNDPLSFDGIASVLRVVGPGLKSLTLDSVLDLDVSLVGHSCPVLKELSVFDPRNCARRLSADASTTDHRPFARLEVLNVFCCDPASGIANVQLLHVLSSCHALRCLHLTLCDEMTDYLIGEVLKVNCFARLESISFDICNNVNVDSMVSLVRLDNPLRVMKLESCKSISISDFHSLMKIARDENFDLDVSWS